MTSQLLAALAALALGAGLAAGCGSSSGGVTAPSIGAASTYGISSFSTGGPVKAGNPFTVSFTIHTPSGRTMTRFRSGPGPHTGVHLIFVRKDLATIVHLHPPLQSDGTIKTQVTLPKPGPYMMLVDVYPYTPGSQYTNFQLRQSFTAGGGKYVAEKLPPYNPVVKVDGYTYRVVGGIPPLHVSQPALINVRVTTPDGKPAPFTPWFGALGHAIFFRKGNLAYFHTHICSPKLKGCTSLVGRTIPGATGAPGKLVVGVLMPEAGTWRLFLQSKVHGRVLTAPFTLTVH
jgi:hypothetical protein